MKTTWLLLAGTLAALLPAACKWRHPEPSAVIHGQVFLVLRSGEAVKLALASVSVVKEADAIAAADAAKKQTAATFDLARSDLQQEITALSRDLAIKRDSLRKKFESTQAEIEAMREKRDFSGDYSALVAEANALAGELEQGEGLKEKTDALRKNRDAALQNFPNEFAEALIAATAATSVTRTNADGEFSLELPRNRGRLALMIDATRELDRVERFVWFVWLDKVTPDGGMYLFSNHNFITAGSEANVVNLPSRLRAP